MKKNILLISLLSVMSSVTMLQASIGNHGSVLVQKSVKTTKYRMAISFISIGAGIDNESYEKIESYIKSHPKKPAYEVVQKGREGERTIYLKLGELSSDERKTFGEEINRLIVKKDLVKVEENAKVRKIRAKF